MAYEIEQLPPDRIGEVEGLWGQLLAHHTWVAPELAAIGAVRPAADSWRIRRGQYDAWLAEPGAAALVARGPAGLLGYAVVRVVHAPGSWQWGDRSGVLETLVVAESARGTGVGLALLTEARRRAAEQGARILKISVIAANERALRFYRREGAVDFVHTLVLPLSA
jgi:ribosomal protein S18 acetylase RimI-like enzyme